MTLTPKQRLILAFVARRETAATLQVAFNADRGQQHTIDWARGGLAALERKGLVSKYAPARWRITTEGRAAALESAETAS